MNNHSIKLTDGNLALLWSHGLHICHRLHMLWCRLRNGKVWRWYLSYGCLETRSHRQEYVILQLPITRDCLLLLLSLCPHALIPHHLCLQHFFVDIVPVIMAGIIGIYGLVVSVLISDDLKQKQALFTSFIQLGAGLSVGLAGLAAGFAIGIVGDAGVRGTAQQPRLFVGMILILIFAEVLGLYGLIVALLMNAKATTDVDC